jgi:hypothetical protein
VPEFPLIPADADYYVKPERLWFSLLSQLRGKLAKYKVPVRDNLLKGGRKLGLTCCDSLIKSVPTLTAAL